MITGKGTLVLRDGRRFPLTYQFGSNYDDTRAGFLFCDTSDLDHASLCQRLCVICEDGLQILIAVMHSNDKYLAVAGRVARCDGFD